MRVPGETHPRHHYGLLHRFRYRHRLLLAVLIGFFLTLPAIENGWVPSYVGSLLFTFVVVPSVIATGRNARLIGVGLLLASPSVVVLALVFFGIVPRNATSEAVHAGSMAAVLLFAVVAMGRHLFVTTAVNEETLAASIGVYVLIGYLFASLYEFHYHVIGGTLSGMPGPLSMSQFVYFSFTTLTTVGFGELIPATPFARALANIEGVAGQVFLVVLVARLVGRSMLERDG